MSTTTCEEITSELVAFLDGELRPAMSRRASMLHAMTHSMSSDAKTMTRLMINSTSR